MSNLLSSRGLQRVLALFVAAVPCVAAPFVVTASTDASAMVANLISGASGITVVGGSQLLINPGANANGFFTGGSGIIPFNSGLVLTSGSINNVVGPNNSASATLSHNAPGDAELTALAGNATFDASVLQFDFVPTGNTISFQFVFASEEYNEFVGSQFNDVFAFYLNGSNIALIPNTNAPITINSVNNGANSAYFFDNTGGARNTQMDGLVGATTELFAVGNVNVGVSNRIRIAIADTSDRILDSAVFIAANSFIDQPPPTGIPEPGTYVLLGSGLAALVLMRRR